MVIYLNNQIIPMKLILTYLSWAILFLLLTYHTGI